MLAKNHPYSQTERPDKQEERLYWQEVESVWKILISNITNFANALKDRSIEGNQMRRDIRKTYLLGKPIGQRVLVSAFLDLTEIGELSGEDACDRLNQVNWRIDNEMWLNVLTRDSSRVMDGKTVIKLGRDFVTYLSGRPLSEGASKELSERIQPEEPKYSLPQRVCSEIEDWPA